MAGAADERGGRADAAVALHPGRIQNARVVKFSRDGKYLLDWGRRGKGPGEFDGDGKFITEWTGTGAISGLAITKDQRIWTGAVLRTLDGAVVGRLPRGEGAHGVAVSDAGDVYLAQLNGVVEKFSKH